MKVDFMQEQGQRTPNKLTIDKKDGSTMNIICYACSRSDGVLNNIRLLNDMSKEEQDAFRQELIITSAKAIGYKMKNRKNACKKQKK